MPSTEQLNRERANEGFEERECYLNLRYMHVADLTKENKETRSFTRRMLTKSYAEIVKYAVREPGGCAQLLGLTILRRERLEVREF